MIKLLSLQNRSDDGKNYNFRFDISFLRVIAVFAVLFYHYNIFPFRSGFVGVDIFFVISGFLMTKIILSGFDKNNFNLVEFYKKRVVRIFPALLMTLLIFSVLVYLFIPTQFLQYLKSMYSSSMFFSNITYYLNNGYFSSASHNNFLLHTWSLSVEWQFYLIYPIILLILRKFYFSYKILFIIIFWFLIVISFLCMIYYNKSDNSFSFYIFYTRAWEMLFGGLAYLYGTTKKSLNNKLKIILSIISYLVLGYCIVFLGTYTWPSYITLIPVCATTLLIMLNVNFIFYKVPILKYLGDLSYSLYLYHWPVYVFSMFFSFNLDPQHKVISIIVSIILAVLSYELIEKKEIFKRTKWVLFASLFLFVFGYSLSKFDGNNYSNDAGELMNVTANYKDTNAEKQYNLSNKHFTDSKTFKNFDMAFLEIPKNNKKNVVLIGDSHAGMFAQTFEGILNNVNCNFIQITGDGTYPMINSKSDLKEVVKYFNYIYNEYFKINGNRIDLIVISSNYAAYSKEEVLEKLDFTNNYFDKMHIKYIYIGQTQTYPIEYPTYYYMKKRYQLNFSLDKGTINKNTNDYLKTRLGNKYIDLLNVKVDTIINGNYPYVYDMNHLTFYGTELYKDIIQNKIASEISNIK